MNYCSHCGSQVVIRIPEGDERPRHMCDSCGTIHYQNPKIVAGALPVWNDQILMCRRAIEPRLGLWTLPAGFMENQETVPEAACRESYEEAQAQLQNLELYTVISLPHISQVYMLYRAEVVDGIFAPGIESLETKLYNIEDIPWGELAFPTIHHTLKHYIEDREKGDFPVHSLTITPKR